VLPHDDQDLPSTGFSNVNRDAILQVLIAPGDRRVGARLPLAVDVDVATKIAHPGQMMCVRLTGDPGTVLFPLGDDCPDDAATMSVAGAAGAASEKPAGAARACMTVQPADSSQSATNGGATGTAGSPGKQKTFTGRLTARAVAAYQPQASEAIATVFANLYSDAGCSELLQSTAVELKLTDTEVPGDGGGGGSGPEGGAPVGGAGGAPSGGNPNGGAGAGGSSGGEAGQAPAGTNAGGAAGTADAGGNPGSAGQGGHP
jgi:hypothetical protein